MIWDILSAHRHLTDHLARAGLDAPRICAEVLLAHVLDIERIAIYSRYDEPVSREDLDRVNALSRRLVAGEPLQLVVGSAQFMSYLFEVEKGVLIPRPETEVLVERTVMQLESAGMNRAPRICDLGTGAGVIAVSLLKLLPGARVVATDTNAQAATLARRNARNLGVEDRLDVLEGDLFEPLDGTGHGPFDAVISNPPYVCTAEIAGLDPVVREYDPHSALDGGADGIDVVRRIIVKTPEWLDAGGMLGLEVGCVQAQQAAQYMRDAGLVDVAVEKDLSGIERCVFARWAP